MCIFNVSEEECARVTSNYIGARWLFQPSNAETSSFTWRDANHYHHGKYLIIISLRWIKLRLARARTCTAQLLPQPRAVYIFPPSKTIIELDVVYVCGCVYALDYYYQFYLSILFIFRIYLWNELLQQYMVI